jgi:hypothetical protein
MAGVEVIDLTLSSPEKNTPSNRSTTNGKRSGPPSSPTAAKGKRRAKKKRSSTSNQYKAEYKDDDDDLFFVDLTSTEHPSTSQAVLPVTNGKEEGLLLPQHVTLFAGTAMELGVRPLSDLEDDDFIKYIDYEDTKVRLIFIV